MKADMSQPGRERGKTERKRRREERWEKVRERTRPHTALPGSIGDLIIV